MELHKIKEKILNNTFYENFIIFVCPENFFIANQYVEAIIRKSGKEKRIIKSLTELDSAMSLLLLDPNDYINVLQVETFEEFREDYSTIENTIIICNKIDKKLKDLVADYVVEVPILKEWQLESYVKQRCPALDDLEISWLVRATNKDIYKIENELDKLSLFSNTKQKEILAHLKFDLGSDLYFIDIFNLCDAIIYNNKNVIANYLKHQQVCNFEFLSLVGIILKKAKNLLLTKYSRRSATELGLNQAYYNRLIKEPFIDQNRLQYIIKTVSGLDLQLKSGLLDLDKDSQLVYLISKLCD